MAARTILVTGATGNQGGAVITALSNLSISPPFKILALTRNASSPSSKRLATNPKITIVEGDYSSASKIFASHPSIYGVFLVTMVSKGETEVEQAKPLIDESIAHGVQHFIFTATDRGGDKVSETNPTNIHHFATKFRIEQYLKAQIAAKNSSMKWTILRPTAFMDNFHPGMMGKGFAAMWKGVGSKPLQLISVRDVGLFGANAFAKPEEYQGRAISLAGDELTFEQGKEVWRKTLGYEMPETFEFMGTALKWAVSDLGTMFKWFETDGFGADVQALRREEPRLQTLGMWLKESSPHVRD